MRPLYPLLIGVSLAAVLLSGGANLGASLLGGGTTQSRVTTPAYAVEGSTGQKFSFTVVRDGSLVEEVKDFAWEGNSPAARAHFLEVKANITSFVEGKDLTTIPPVDAQLSTNAATREAFEKALLEVKKDFGL